MSRGVQAGCVVPFCFVGFIDLDTEVFCPFIHVLMLTKVQMLSVSLNIPVEVAVC